jgi:hypothetical protein
MKQQRDFIMLGKTGARARNERGGAWGAYIGRSVMIVSLSTLYFSYLTDL